jgi:hypothetical protein
LENNMTTRKAPSTSLRRVAPLPGPGQGTHIQPTEAQRAAADSFLREATIEPAMRACLDRAVAGFDDAQQSYVEAARRQGEGSRVWDTAGWIVANAIAREAAEKAST